MFYYKTVRLNDISHTIFHFQDQPNFPSSYTIKQQQIDFNFQVVCPKIGLYSYKFINNQK